MGLVSLLAAPAAQAQQSGRTYRVGMLNGGSPSADTYRFVDAIRDGLRERGWIEGRNIAYEIRWSEGDAGRFPKMAEELVRVGVDLLIAPSTDAAVAAKRATATIPIVMVFPLDPVPLGLVASYSRPGSNVTGLTTEAGGAKIVAKYFDLLTQTLPGVSRVAVLWNATSPQQAQTVEDMQAFAGALHLELRAYHVRSPEAFPETFARIREERCGALIILADSMFFRHRATLADLARQHRLPAMSSVRDFVEAGGLIRYVPDLLDLHRSAVRYVDRILRGAHPAELPVEQPAKFDLVINLQTARALGLKIPQSVLVRADKLIE